MYKLKTLIFPLAVFALGIFLHVYWKETATQLLFFVPALIGIAIILTNNEEPIVPLRFWGGVILCLVTLIIIMGVGASKMSQ